MEWLKQMRRSAIFLVTPLVFALGHPAVTRAMRLGETFSQQSLADSPQMAFEPPEVTSAGDVQYPLQTTAEGIVVADVSLSASGEITGVNVVSDIPPLTDAAQASLRTWKFKPASRDGVNEASQMMVAFVFRHAVTMGSPPLFRAAFPAREENGYIAPGIFSVRYADYPAGTVAAGATVIQVEVDANSEAGKLDVVRGMEGGFVPMALKAASQWQFQAAVLDGTPVASKVAVAFVFSSRALNPF